MILGVYIINDNVSTNEKDPFFDEISEVLLEIVDD